MINIMWIALITFLGGSLYMTLTWYRCRQLNIVFTGMAKFWTMLGAIGFTISLLFMFDVERVLLHYLFSVMGMVYLISTLYPKGKHNGKKMG